MTSATGTIQAVEDKSSAPLPGAAWTLTAVSVSTFLLMLDLTVVNVAIPDIQRALGASFSSMQWTLDAYALGLAALVLASGSIADRFGKRRVFAVGLVLFTLASLACGLAPSAAVLIAARAFQGLAAAVLFAIGPALLGDAYPGRGKGMAFGVFGGVSGMAIAFGPLIGGSLTDAASWSWIFLVNIPLSLGALVITLAKTPVAPPHPDTAPRLDVLGLVLFTAGITALVWAVLRVQELGWTDPQVLAAAFVGIATLVAFVRVERRKGPLAMIDLAYFSNRTASLFSVVTFVGGASVMASLFLLITYVQNTWQLSAFETGVRFLPMTGTLFVCAALAGLVSDRLPPRLLMGLSQTFVSTGLFLTLLSGSTAQTWTRLLPAMVFLGAGMGLFNAPRAVLSIAVVPPSKAGAGSGISETFQQVGVAVGIAALGTAFVRFFTRELTAGPAGEMLGGQADQVAAAIAENPSSLALPAGTDPATQEAVMSAAVTAATNALHSSMIIAGVLTCLSAVAGFAMRRSDLYTS
ncbi:MAG: MFS transporter [Micrococcales bacterium]|nr:MFS transporter [Micrococcales bacterium]MCL2666241.1 MFS transporter [Micrococcales bacterium]